MKLVGGCLCGAVRYQTPSEPVTTLLCECHNCQRQTSAPFSVIIAIKKGTLEYTGDRPVFYQHLGGSGRPVRRYYCAKCGSPIVAELEVTPELDWLKAATLDDNTGPWMKPQVCIWGSSGQQWVELPEGVPQYEENAPAA